MLVSPNSIISRFLYPVSLPPVPFEITLALSDSSPVLFWLTPIQS